MIELNQDKFLGNYRGQVTSNADPFQKGRIQVQILPMFSGAAAADLPWAVPAMPLFCGADTGKGSLCIPDVGSWVWCFFEEGEYTQPVYFAEAGNGSTGVPDATSYPHRRVLYSGAGIKLIMDDTLGTLILHAPVAVNITAPAVNIN